NLRLRRQTLRISQFNDRSEPRLISRSCLLYGRIRRGDLNGRNRRNRTRPGESGKGRIPLLHSLEESELLKSYNEVHEGKVRRYYKITSEGRRQLKKAKLRLIELMGEILTKDEVEQLSASSAIG